MIIGQEKGPVKDGKINGLQSTIFPCTRGYLESCAVWEKCAVEVCPVLSRLKGTAVVIVGPSDLHDLICASAIGFA